MMQIAVQKFVSNWNDKYILQFNEQRFWISLKYTWSLASLALITRAVVTKIMLQIPLPYLNTILAAHPSSFSPPLNYPPSPKTVCPPLLPSSPPPLQSFPLTHAACLPSPFPPSLLISSYIPFHPFPFSRPFLFSLFSFFSPFPPSLQIPSSPPDSSSSFSPFSTILPFPLLPPSP